MSTASKIGSERRTVRARAAKCIVCACTDDFACDEGCEWVSADPICSRCNRVAVAIAGQVVDFLEAGVQRATDPAVFALLRLAHSHALGQVAAALTKKGALRG